MQTFRSRIRSFVFLNSWERRVPAHTKMPSLKHISITALLVKEWAQAQHFPYRKVTSGSSQAESNAWGRKPFSPLPAKAQQVETASERKTLPSILFQRLLTPQEWLEAAHPFLTQHQSWPQRFAEKLPILFVRGWQMPTATKTQFEAIMKSPLSIPEIWNSNAFSLYRKQHTKRPPERVCA